MTTTEEKTVIGAALERLIAEEKRRRHGYVNEKTHKTVRVKVGLAAEADVDEEIVPVINWLNGYNSVRTLWCCQGDYAVEEYHRKPYVTFECGAAADIHDILFMFDQFSERYRDGRIRCSFHAVTTKVEYYEGTIRYVARWYDRLALHDFVKHLSNHQYVKESSCER